MLTAGTLYQPDWWAFKEPFGTCTDSMGYKCDIAQLNLQDCRQTILTHMDGHQGPAPLEPAVGVS